LGDIRLRCEASRFCSTAISFERGFSCEVLRQRSLALPSHISVANSLPRRSSAKPRTASLRVMRRVFDAQMTLDVVAGKNEIS
jgi:hypothetical protein